MACFHVRVSTFLPTFAGRRRSGATTTLVLTSLVRGVGVVLLCDIRKWAAYASTPLWLSVQGPTFKEAAQAHEILAPFSHETPKKMYSARDGYPCDCSTREVIGRTGQRATTHFTGGGGNQRGRTGMSAPVTRESTIQDYRYASPP